jgi:hypothetical protein
LGEVSFAEAAPGHHSVLRRVGRGSSEADNSLVCAAAHDFAVERDERFGVGSRESDVKRVRDIHALPGSFERMGAA